jgi:hypothetical protein
MRGCLTGSERLDLNVEWVIFWVGVMGVERFVREILIFFEIRG